MLRNKRASSAAANNPIRIIFATCNRGRSVVKSAMNSPSRFAAHITARSIASSHLRFHCADADRGGGRATQRPSELIEWASKGAPLTGLEGSWPLRSPFGIS